MMNILPLKYLEFFRITNPAAKKVGIMQSRSKSRYQSIAEPTHTESINNFKKSSSFLIPTVSIFFTLLLALPFSLFAQTAKIKIDVNRIIGEIDPNIYGVFMEPIEFNPRRFGSSDTTVHNTMYGTLYNPSSPLADENGFKRNYFEAMKELRITNMRWPGDNYVAGYSWQDGIGPKEQLSVRKDLAWGGIDNKHVGTDEWVQLNRSIGSENVICINLGLGNSVDTYVECDTFNTEKFKGIPFLDVTTVHSKETSTIFINVVNRHKDKEITANIINNSGAFTGKAEASLVNSDSLNAFFTFDTQEKYIPVTKDIKVEGNKISYSFPAHSFTQIKVGVKE